MSNTDEWNLGGTSWKDSNPFGLQAENFIWDNPNWAIYFRKDQRFKCPGHYSISKQSSFTFNEYCPKCLGFGIYTTAMIIPVRVNLGQAKLSVRSSDMRLLPGFMEHYVTTLDFPRNAKPQLEDVVLFCDWNKNYQDVPRPPVGRPLNVTSIYLVKSLNDHIERELGWFDTGVEGFDYNEDWANTYIPHLVNLPVLQKEVWPQEIYW